MLNPIDSSSAMIHASAMYHLACCLDEASLGHLPIDQGSSWRFQSSSWRCPCSNQKKSAKWCDSDNLFQYYAWARQEPLPTFLKTFYEFMDVDPALPSLKQLFNTTLPGCISIEHPSVVAAPQTASRWWRRCGQPPSKSCHTSCGTPTNHLRFVTANQEFLEGTRCGNISLQY